MHFHRVLDEVFGRRSKVVLLRLLSRLGGDHTGRDLARLSELDHKTCHAALHELAEQCVVTCRKVGNALAYGLNSQHAVVRQIVRPVFREEAALIENFAADVRRSVAVTVDSVILFGSVARGEEEAASDVDLLLVVPDPATARKARSRLDEIMVDLSRRYGSIPQVLVSDRRTACRKLHRDPLYQEILRTGRVLHGKSFARLMSDVA